MLNMTCLRCGDPILGDGTEERDWSDYCSDECDSLAHAEADDAEEFLLSLGEDSQ